MNRPSRGLFVLLLPSLLLVRPAAAPAADAAPPWSSLTARPIGPANMGGRVCAVASPPGKPATLYVATASGGLWKTTDGGASWEAQFEHEATVSLGDVCVAPSNPDVVWVGTGEANARNSVSWGDGVYKSADGGKTWKNMGLRDTQHIGKVLIHPKDPDTVYVAALGHVWGPNKERGLFKTTDGGKTWACVNFIDEETGFIDLAMDPSDPDTLYAAAYRVRRDGFSGGNPEVMYGPKAGLYKTTDGGKTWTKLTKGLPDRLYGRCGLDVYRKDPRVLYAVVQTDRTDVHDVPGQAPTKEGLAVGAIDTGGVFKSTDKGETWTKVNDVCPRPFYFGQVRVDPNDANRVWVFGVSMFGSTDGGKTFKSGAAPGTHADHHALWIDPADSNRMVIGCDGGVYLSNDKGAKWEHVRNLPIGQFYGVTADMRKPYKVYGGLQDNGSWGGPSRTRTTAGIGVADWTRILGSDGFQCAADPNDNDTVYAETQYARELRRINVRTGQRSNNLVTAPAKGEPEYRFNWNAPMLLSPHDSNTIYFGGNHLFRSVNRGDRWERLGPDLTRGKPGDGPRWAHTLTTIAESPLKKGLLYVGSDDGKVQVSRDGGQEWKDVSDNVPSVAPDRHITRVECSPFAEGTAYLALSRHRNDDRRPYLFKTTDHGETWQSIAGNLPAGGPVNVIRCDPRNQELLYAGTEFGLFASLDGGTSWQPLGQLPTVSVHDVVVHPRDRELVIGTHGRSVYVLDVVPLQEMNAKMLAAPAYLCDVVPATAFKVREPAAAPAAKTYVAPNPEYGAVIWYHLKDKADTPVRLRIRDGKGEVVADLIGEGTAGLHKVRWDLRRGGDGEKPLVAAGEYEVTLEAGAARVTKKLKVEAEE
jgi:photosystem II stability/assembly factor-like uncharacterized protein